MLPFLKPRKSDGGSIVTEYRKPDDQDRAMDADSVGLDAAASDLIEAIHNKDKKLAAQALKSFFEIIDSMPHVEGEHVEE